MKKLQGNIKAITVRQLIKKLEKFNPDSLALYHFCAEIGDKIVTGYIPFIGLKAIKVIKKKGKDDWYEESNNPKATEVIVINQ